MTTEPTLLTARLERWVERGLITADQAERIRADERDVPPTPPTSGPSLVTEALGYVGGVLVLVAAATITGRFWSELGIGGRLTVACVAAALLFLAGLFAGRAATSSAGVGSQGAAAARGRLRSVSWLLSAVLLAGALGIVGDDVLELRGDLVTFLAAGVTALYAVLLWRAHLRVLQQVAVVAALTVTVGGAAALLPRDNEDVIGLAMWGVGAAWLVLAWGRAVPGGTVAARNAAYVLGGIAAMAGSMMTTQHDWGSALTIATAVALVAMGVAGRDLVLLAVGAVATLWAVPVILYRYFPDTIVAAFALLVVGALLVAGALYTARRRRAVTPGRERGALSAPDATAAAAAIAAVVAVLVLVLGLA